MRALVLVGVAAAALAVAPSSSAAVAPVRWCGNDVQPTDRLRDRMGGPQIHVVYAIPADGQNRFAEVATPIATDVAAIDAWWRREDPTRAPRFDLFDFPGCESRMGLLDLSSVQLPRPASGYASLQARFDAVVRDLSQPPFELADPDKRYLVFYDGVVVEDDVCGIGAGRPTRGPGYAVVHLRSGCNLQLGTGHGAAWVGAHELIHALGAVPGSAPNACQDGHVCDSPLDLMAPSYRDVFLDEGRLDVGRDDYYAHSHPLFDLRTSSWLLDAAQVALTLRVTGRGLIGSLPDDQACSVVCLTEWDGGTAVQLSAAPGSGYGFAGWTGACAAARAPSCLLDLNASAEVGAVFRPLRRLAVRVAGRGTVTGTAGLQCSRSCARQVLHGQPFALRARAARGWRFLRWTGACRGSRPACTIRLTRAARVTAVFARR